MYINHKMWQGHKTSPEVFWRGLADSTVKTGKDRYALTPAEIFGNVNAVGFLLKPELASVSVNIRGFGEGEGVEVNDVAIHRKEVIITLV